MAQLVVFDCHGVLVGSEALSSVIYAETLTAFGCAIDAETVAARYTGFSVKITVAAVNDD
jgi:beta-phosphoglucomutase-like phosphatase (HAD superfamily)